LQLNPDDPLSFIFITGNAARGENYGLEADGIWQLTERLRLSGNLGLLQTRYIDYAFGARDLSGREQAYSPQYQLAAAVEYRLAGGWFARFDAQSVDAFYFDTSHDQRSHPYTITNLRLGIETERFTASVWARNLFNASYALRGFYFQQEPPDFPYKLYVQQGDPRQIGFTLTYNFI
jgi:outer membrane receptor protein involved in Fe transport